MNTFKRIVSMILLYVLVVISGCGLATSGNNTDKQKEKTDNITSIYTTPDESLKSANVDKEEAVQVLTDYFTAIKTHEENKANQCVTERLRNDEGYSNIKDAKIVEIKEDVDGKCKKAYNDNQGSITKHSAVICFEVTYNIQYVDDSLASEESGVVTKWFTLIKEKETSPWLIDEWGY